MHPLIEMFENEKSYAITSENTISEEEEMEVFFLLCHLLPCVKCFLLQQLLVHDFMT